MAAGIRRRKKERCGRIAGIGGHAQPLKTMGLARRPGVRDAVHDPRRCAMQAVVSERSGRGAVFACSGGFALAVLLMLYPVPKAGAARLGGPYFVDDAEIGKVGSCEVESWNSSAGNGDRISVFSPACVVNFGAPVELGTNLVNARSDGDGISTISLTAKTVPIPIGPSGFGLALSGACLRPDPTRRQRRDLHRPGDVRFEQTAAQYQCRRAIQRQPGRALRHRRRGRLLEFREPVEHHFGGVRDRRSRHADPRFQSGIQNSPDQRCGLGRHLRPQPDRRTGQLDHAGAHLQIRRLLTGDRLCTSGRFGAARCSH